MNRFPQAMEFDAPVVDKLKSSTAKPGLAYFHSQRSNGGPSLMHHVTAVVRLFFYACMMGVLGSSQFYPSSFLDRSSHLHTRYAKQNILDDSRRDISTSPRFCYRESYADGSGGHLLKRMSGDGY